MPAPARIGQIAELGLFHAPRKSPAFAIIGGGRLSLNLGPLGAPGCVILTNPDIMLVGMTDAAGEARILLPVPNDPALVGRRYNAQYLVADPTANGLGGVSTRAIELVIRGR